MDTPPNTDQPGSAPQAPEQPQQAPAAKKRGLTRKTVLVAILVLVALAAFFFPREIGSFDGNSNYNGGDFLCIGVRVNGSQMSAYDRNRCFGPAQGQPGDITEQYAGCPSGGGQLSPDVCYGVPISL